MNVITEEKIRETKKMANISSAFGQIIIKAKSLEAIKNLMEEK